ncbi:nucleotidyltransferase family protein [Cereibacter azotoformans]|nr:nucleotidyltransferase family protein [Cereibacter azotoformans]MBO4169274.1 nucleotidyltransferase family protein [Cereibacter azotoformans]
MAPPAPVVLLLAAGASRRMRGADKLLEPVGGVPLLRLQAARALEAGLPLVVTLPPDRPARVAALDGLDLIRVTVADTASGLSASIRAGLGAVPEGRAVLILLADLPEIEASDLAALAALHHQAPAAILRATSADGRPGHPILFPADLRADLLALEGDAGARTLLRREAARVRPVALEAARAITDLDTPEDWAAWRARTGR